MTSPATLSMTLSIIGAVTGIVGTITGLISYRRSQQIKALDLRLELRKQVSDVRHVVDALPALLQQAQVSRMRVRAAMGSSKTGALENWRATLESDPKAAEALAREVPDADETYRRSTHQHLETKLVEVHALATKAAGLRDKYRAELASDERDREYIRTTVGRGSRGQQT